LVTQHVVSVVFHIEYLTLNSQGGKMQTIISSSKKNLEFTEVKAARYTAKGLLSNEKGDHFNIRITGTQKKYVQDFVDYQVKNVKSKGISVTIGSRKAKKKIEKEIEDIQNNQTSDNIREYTQIKKFRGISIDISPNLSVKNLSNKPLALHYEIDPPIGQNDKHDYTFHNTGTVTIGCEVNEGSINIELFEFKNALHTTSNQKLSIANTLTPLVSTGNPGKFSVAHDSSMQGNGDWNFRVTGASRAKYKLIIDLTWDLTKDFSAAEALKAGVALH
jgi:hypothetical protein